MEVLFVAVLFLLLLSTKTVKAWCKSLLFINPRFEAPRFLSLEATTARPSTIQDMTQANSTIVRVPFGLVVPAAT